MPPTRPALRGAFTALVTPFTADGALDEAAFRRARPLAGPGRHRRPRPRAARPASRPPCRADERDRLHRDRPSRSWPSGRRAARVPVVAGTGTNDTAATIAATRRAADARCRRRAGRRAVLQPARPADARGALPGGRRRGRPADRRLQRPVADGHERRGRHVPAARRAPAGRSRSRRRAATSSRSPGSAATGRATSRSWPATTPGRSPILALGGDGVVSVASQRDPGRDGRRCARPARPATGTRRAGSTSAGCRCSAANFRGGPNPVPVKAALLAMGLIETGRRSAAPLLPLDDRPR